MKSTIKKLIYTFVPHMYDRLPAKNNAIYITFDDGPNPDYTDIILQAFKKQNMSATFFLVGSEMDKYPELVRRIYDQGHTVGYHSYSHDSQKSVSFSDFLNDLKKARALADKFSIKINLYRPPYGDLTLFKFLWLILSGWKIIMWSHDSRDSFDEKEAVLQAIKQQTIEPGSIHLFHDDYVNTADIMSEVLTHYADNGINCYKILL